MTEGQIIGTWVAAGLTLMMFSFIYKDNVLFKFGEHLYLGISVGYFINVHYWNTLYPEVYRRITVDHNYWVLIPAVLGIFVLLRLVPQLAWLSRTSFALYIGGASGYTIPNVVHGALLVQIYETLRPLNADRTSLADVPTDLNQLVVLVGVFAVLIFFFFSLEHKKLIGGVSKVGLYFLMLGFGAAFGSTVMGRISLLIGRFQFLKDEWFTGMIVNRFFGGGG